MTVVAKISTHVSFDQLDRLVDARSKAAFLADALALYADTDAGQPCADVWRGAALDHG